MPALKQNSRSAGKERTAVRSEPHENSDSDFEELSIAPGDGLRSNIFDQTSKNVIPIFLRFLELVSAATSIGIRLQIALSFNRRVAMRPIVFVTLDAEFPNYIIVIGLYFLAVNVEPTVSRVACGI